MTMLLRIGSSLIMKIFIAVTATEFDKARNERKAMK